MKIKAYKKKHERALQKRRHHDLMLRDVYDYVTPYRSVTGLHVENGEAEGATRVDKCFDATAIKAAFRFAGRVQTELTPIFQSFFALEPGPLIPDGEDRKVLAEEFQKIGAICNGVLASGTYHNAAHESYVDLYAGTSHKLVLEGDDIDIARFLCVPVAEVACEVGPYGDIEHWFWEKPYMLADLPVMWPDGKFSEQLQRAIKEDEDGERETQVVQYTWYDRAAGNYRLAVWCDRCASEDGPFHEETFRTSPWITTRFFRIPGEINGRGPAMLAMPFIKTANKTRELQLKGAALALMGIWAYRDDGVFNPKTVKFEPRAMWAVSSTGGPMGPTVQRLNVGENFEVGGVVMADEREQMKLALFDDTLPPEGAAVKSATEIAERISRLSQDMAGAYGRLVLEDVVPLVKRLIDILERKGKLKTSLKIDQLLTQVRVIAPIAAAQMAARVQAATRWAEIVGFVGGPGAFKRIAREETLLPDIGRWLGNDEKYIRSPSEIAKRDKEEQATAQAQQQAELAKAMPDQPPMSSQIINGGMV